MLSLCPRPSASSCAPSPPTSASPSTASSALVRQALGDDPLSVATGSSSRNRKGDRLKILAWEEDGWCLWYKRLERGVFRFPAAAGGRAAPRRGPRRRVGHAPRRRRPGEGACRAAALSPSGHGQVIHGARSPPRGPPCRAALRGYQPNRLTPPPFHRHAACHCAPHGP